MGKYSGLIILALIVLKIVTSIMQYARKQQERQRTIEAAKRRALEEAGVGVVVSRQAPPTAPVARMPADEGDLEARRREQLEQLRQRRQGRRMVASVQTAGSGRQGFPGQARSTMQRSEISEAPAIGTSDQARVRAQEAERRKRGEERSRREQQGRLVAERERIAAEQTQREQTARERRQTAQAAQAVQAAQQPSVPIGAVLGRPGAADRGGAPAAAFARQLHQPATLRDLIILREVMDRPVSLRDAS